MSVNILSVTFMSVNILSVTFMSVNILSVTFMSVNILSVNILSVNIKVWSKYRRFQYGFLTPDLEVWLMAT